MLTKVLFGLFVAALLGNFGQWVKNGNLAADLKLAQATTESWQLGYGVEKENAKTCEANSKTNLATIETLKQDVQHANDLRASAETAGIAALHQLAQARETIAQAARREAIARAKIYESDATCAAWAATPVCGAIADRLRQSAGQSAAPGT